MLSISFVSVYLGYQDYYVTLLLLCVIFFIMQYILANTYVLKLNLPYFLSFFLYKIPNLRRVPFCFV